MNELRDRQEPTNSNNIFSPPLPPAIPAPGPGPFITLLQPPFQLPQSVFNSFQPPPPRPDKSFGNFHIPARLSSANFGNRYQGLSGNLLGLQTQIFTREKEKEKIVKDTVQSKLGETIYELPDPPRLELGDDLLNSLVFRSIIF